MDLWGESPIMSKTVSPQGGFANCLWAVFVPAHQQNSKPAERFCELSLGCFFPPGYSIYLEFYPIFLRIIIIGMIAEKIFRFYTLAVDLPYQFVQFFALIIHLAQQYS